LSVPQRKFGCPQSILLFGTFPKNIAVGGNSSTGCHHYESFEQRYKSKPAIKPRQSFRSEEAPPALAAAGKASSL
jgi:hypothetical protein